MAELDGIRNPQGLAACCARFSILYRPYIFVFNTLDVPQKVNPPQMIVILVGPADQSGSAFEALVGDDPSIESDRTDRTSIGPRKSEECFRVCGVELSVSERRA